MPEKEIKVYKEEVYFVCGMSEDELKKKYDHIHLVVGEQLDPGCLVIFRKPVGAEMLSREYGKAEKEG